MDLEAIFSRASAYYAQNKLATLLGICGLTLFIGGLIWSIAPFSQQESVEFQSASASDSGLKPEMTKELFIDIEGAVVKPGVYKLSGDIRVQDVLIAAGGLAEAADRNWVSKSLNLAAKVQDGAKIYVPAQGESTGHGPQSTAVAGSQSTIGGLININSASISELDKLPGVGMVTAQKIIDNRPYSTIDDLLTKKIVGSKVYSQIKEKITTY